MNEQKWILLNVKGPNQSEHFETAWTKIKPLKGIGTKNEPKLKVQGRK